MHNSHFELQAWLNILHNQCHKHVSTLCLCLFRKHEVVYVCACDGCCSDTLDGNQCNLDEFRPCSLFLSGIGQSVFLDCMFYILSYSPQRYRHCDCRSRWIDLKICLRSRHRCSTRATVCQCQCACYRHSTACGRCWGQTSRSKADGGHTN